MKTRIPRLKDTSEESAQGWFNKMAILGLLFHPDDAPEEIINIDNRKGLFSEKECKELEHIIETLFKHHGDKVYDFGLAAYHI